jgi:hypothetical protein
MGRLHKYFVAPGPEDEDLSIPESPWHSGRFVRLPLEHFIVLSEFARTIDPVRAEHLWELANPESGRTSASPQVLDEALAFLALLRQQLLDAPPLVPCVTEEFPEDFTPAEHARMLDAIAAVLQAAKVQAQPFAAGSE